MRVVLLSVLFFPTNIFALESLRFASEYYYEKADYGQSISLWNELAKSEPTNLNALFRVAELKLIFEGRPSARSTLNSYFLLEGSPLQDSVLKDRLKRILTIFLTDESQSLYLQAKQKMREKNFEGALTLLEQADQLENGNIQVLIEKARCEKALKAYENFYKTLRLAFQLNPLNESLLEELYEAGIYFGEAKRVLESHRQEWLIFGSSRYRTAYSVGLVEAGKNAEALPILQALVEKERFTSVHPIVFFMMAKVLSQKGNFHSGARYYLEKFLAASGRPERCAIDGWDPYKTTERVEDAKRLLSILNRDG